MQCVRRCMNLNKTEKEFIRAIVKYDGKARSLADVLNKSRLLEKRGIGIVQHYDKNIIFLRKDIYEERFDRNGLGYVVGLLSLIDTLIKKKYITMIPFVTDDILVIGAKESKRLRPEFISVNDNEGICLADRNENWFDASNHQKYWPCTFTDNELYLGNIFNAYSVSEGLRTLVKNNFKSAEEIRFIKQQRLTWISIAVAAVLGLLGIIF